MENKKDALKLCPFCGGEPEKGLVWHSCNGCSALGTVYDNCDAGIGQWIQCKECGAKVSSPSNDNSYLEKWNTRTNN